jgi:pimeloyl-ACP methyl ester carboxylesterase
LECIQFENDGLNLVGMLHIPHGVGPFPAVTFCHGFTGQRYEPGWIYVRVARRLAEAGIASFRFDCRFSGESDGEFRDMTISTEIADTLRAMDVVRSRPEIDQARLGLLGFSLGGTVAAETAARRQDVRSLLLWSPVSDPGVQFADRAEKMAGDALDIGPVLLGRGFVEDLPNHAPVEATRRWGGPVRIIHGTMDPVVNIASGRAYLDGPGRREFVPVEGAEHGWFGAGNQKALFDATVEWFRDTL